MKEVEHEMLFW